MFNSEGRLVLTADKAFLHNNEGSANSGVREHDGIPHVGHWTDAQAHVEWTFQAEPGEYEVLAEFSDEAPKTEFSFGLVGAPQVVEAESTGDYGKYRQKRLGVLQVETDGEQTIRIKPKPGAWNPINLRNVELRRR